MMEDEDVVLIKSDVHKTVTFGPYKDDENKIRIELVKRSSETKKLLNDAVYEIYDEDQDIVATLITGTSGDGTAECYLPYGNIRSRKLLRQQATTWMTQKKNLLS